MARTKGRTPVEWKLERMNPPMQASEDVLTVIRMCGEIRERNDGTWHSLGSFPESDTAAANRASTLKKRPELADMDLRGSKDPLGGSRLFARIANWAPDEVSVRRGRPRAG